jgi:hypothetical protein
MSQVEEVLRVPHLSLGRGVSLEGCVTAERILGDFDAR